MAQAQQIMSETALSMIRLAEHPNTEPNVMSVASTKLFERLRKEGVSLIDVIYTAENQNANFQPQSNLVMKNAHLNTEVFHQKTMIAKLEKKVFTLGKRLAVAQNDNAELREASKKAKAKFSVQIESASKTSDAKIAALKAELKSARAQAAADRADLAAERAKPAPISASVVVALAKMTRDQEAEITMLKGALAKVAPTAAPDSNTPASAPAASAGLSKRSQGAFKAWATRRAKAAAAAPTAPATAAPSASTLTAHQVRARKAWVTRRRAKTSAAAPLAPAPATPKARKAPRTGSLRADVLELLNVMPGHKFTGNDLAKFRLWLFPNNCAGKAAFHSDEWNSLSGQLRTEIHWLRDLLKADGIVALLMPFGTRRRWTYSVPGSVRSMSCHVSVGKGFYQQFRWLRDESRFAPGSWRIDFDKGLGPVVRFENLNDATMFKLAVG